MNLNIFDIVIVALLISFIIAGWKRGVIKEFASFIGIIIVFLLSYMLKGVVGNFLCTILPFLEFSGNFEGIISLNILTYHVVAFILLFLILLGIYRLILKLSNAIQNIINYTIILIIPSKILGAIISFIEGWIVVFIALLVLIVPFKEINEYKDSKLNNIILFKTPVLSDMVKPFTKGVVEIYDVSSKITKKEIDTNEANLKSIDIMLKYKIADKSTIEKLVESKKIKNIEGIDKVLNNY